MKASCCCGKLVVDVRGEPLRVSICHCLACQRRTGSVFGAQARFASDQVTIGGESRIYVRISDDGNAVRFRFCPDCGSTVCYTIDDMPGLTAVPVGAFADPAFPPPRVSVYESRKHGWVTLPDGMEHHD